MCSRAQTKSGRPFRSISVDWHHIAWCPHILPGTPVSLSVSRWTGFDLSVNVFKRDCPPGRSRIQFPTL